MRPSFEQARRPPAVATLIGLALLALLAVLHALSGRFHVDSATLYQPIIAFVALLSAAGLIYLGLLWVLPRLADNRTHLAALVLVGLLARLTMFGSTPILEDDYFRYLWDGALVWHGFSPYAVAPAQAATRPELAALAADAGALLERVNHADLRTIYPPLAQAAFALAHAVSPWSLDAWRGLLLSLDLLNLWLLCLVLRQFDRSRLWAALYWWNPLLIKEAFNAGHMDIVLVPLLLTALLCVARGRQLLATAALAAAAGVKLWPLLLLPTVLRPLAARPGLLALAAALSGGLGALALWPLLSGPPAGAGLLTFAQTWQVNDLLFARLLNALAAFGLEAPGAAARALVALLLLGLALVGNRHAARDPAQAAARMTLLVGALFFLSPAQYPWYLIWLLPFLCLLPCRGLALLTATLPLYYLRFHFAARGDSGTFASWLPWFEFLPALLVLAWEAGAARALGTGRSERCG